MMYRCLVNILCPAGLISAVIKECNVQSSEPRTFAVTKACVAHGQYRIHVTVHLKLLFVYSGIYDYQLLIYRITEDVVG